MKTVEQLLFGKYKASGKKERYALQNLFDYMNSVQEEYKYIFKPTPDDEKIGYEGIVTIKYKLSGNIAGYYIVEAKVRTENYDTLIFEKRKQNTLNKIKREYDKYFKTNYSEHTIGILYINFLPEYTYMFDILTLQKNKLLPKLINKSMNKITVASTEDKEDKLVYLLDKELAIKYKYTFNEKTYANDLLTESNSNLNEVNKILKTTYSIF